MIQRILVQLPYLFGPAAGNPVKVYYRDWAREPFTATEYDQRPAHNQPEFHPPSGKTSVWNDTLHFAGSETADEFGGYLEGALSSAQRAVSSVL
jgi:monoamine oxidase